MKKRKNLWAPILFGLWTVYIFARSLQPADLSNEESGRILSILEQLLPFALSNHFVRKVAHFVEYGVSGFFGWFVFESRRGWERPAFSMTLCLLTALCDETIQLFVEGRGGMIADVWLDMAGVLGGVLGGLIVQKLVCRFRNK